MPEIRHLENRHDVVSLCRGWSCVDKISQTGAEWHVDCGDMVEIENRCRIPIWRTFGRTQWHIIPEPFATLQGVRILSALLKIVFRHVLFYFLFIFKCSLGFDERRLSYRLWYTCLLWPHYVLLMFIYFSWKRDLGDAALQCNFVTALQQVCYGPI